MTLRIYVYLCIFLLCECRININIKVSSSKTGSNISYNGFDDKLITSKEINLYNLSDSNLKKGVRIELGRIPDDVFLNESPKYGDLYKTYKWPRIRRNLRVKKAEVMDVISKNVIVNKIDHINNTTRKSKIRINEFFPVENIVSSAWSKDGLPDDDINYKINIDLILKKVTFDNKWRNTTLKTVEIQFGLKNPGYVEIEPGNTITTKLTARKTTALYKITYKAQLTGSMIVNFAHVYGQYHFYAPKISDIMKANRLNNEILTTEVIEIKCYTDPRMDVFDKSTGRKMAIMFLNKPFWRRKNKNK